MSAAATRPYHRFHLQCVCALAVHINTQQITKIRHYIELAAVDLQTDPPVLLTIDVDPL